MSTDQRPTEEKKRSPAIFLDRDGTLIEDVGILDDPSKISLFPDTIASLLRLQKKYRLFVITCQPHISRGHLTMEQVHTVHNALDQQLSDAGVQIDSWYTCPHTREDNCDCIKPKSAFPLQATKDFNIDLTRSFMIGDHPYDVFTAEKEGVFGLYVLTGHGGKHLDELSPEKLVFHRLPDAADWILAYPTAQADLNKTISKGAEKIKEGGVVAIPTETVYGLAADVFQPEAIQRVFKIKGRPHFNPLIAHIADTKQIQTLSPTLPKKAKQLVEAYWPGPLTIVLPKLPTVPDIVTGGKPSVAIRMPNHPIARQVIEQAGTAVAAPSANLFTYTSPTTAQHVQEQLGDQCDLIIDGGACRIGVESTVISFVTDEPTILRPGGISKEQIEAVIGPVQQQMDKAQEESESPGMLPNHYAPKTKLEAYETLPESIELDEKIGIILLQPNGRSYAGPVEILSETGNLPEAAANFYAALRRLDQLGLDKMVTEYFPNRGIGIAVNNRLSKAAMGRAPLSNSDLPPPH